MASDWLNRIGIILNFLAGFMLAPELIGIQRLSQIETKTETYFNNAKNRFNNLQESINEEKTDLKYLFLRLIISSAFIIVLVWSFLTHRYYIVILFLVLSYCFFVWIGLMLANLVMRFPKARKAYRDSQQTFFVKLSLFWQVFRGQHITLGNTIRQYHFWLLVFPFYLLPLSPKVIASLAWYLIIIPLLVLILILPNILIGFALKRLEGDERVREFVVWLGVIFFIVGNALQLIATF